MKAISATVGIIHNFASKNNPNLDTIDTMWLPINEQVVENYKFKVLNIAQNLTFVDLPEFDGMQLWSSFYDANHLT